MKAITQVAPNELRLLDWPLPEPAAGEVRIQTILCGICATDLHMIAGWERTTCPAIPGHEWFGRVDAVGAGVDPLLLGQRCVGENILPGGLEIGFELPGGYAQYFCTRASNLYSLPDDISPYAAVLAEPLSVCLHAVRKLPNQIGEVLIFGDGPIGLITLALLKSRGTQVVTLVGGKPDHLRLAVEFGADQALNYQAYPDLSVGLRTVLPRVPLGIIEASGSPAALKCALDLSAPTARVVIVGDYGLARADFLWNDLLHREITLVGSNTGSGAWNEAIRLIYEKRLPLEKLVTHHFAAQEFEKAILTARGNQIGAVKVVLEWK